MPFKHVRDCNLLFGETVQKRMAFSLWCRVVRSYGVPTSVSHPLSLSVSHDNDDDQRGKELKKTATSDKIG